MTDAPEKIWLWYDDGRAFVSKPNEPYPADATAYIPKDVALAMVAAHGRRCATTARDACLVPPDGGSPTEEERLVCEEAQKRIRSLTPDDAKAALDRLIAEAEARGVEKERGANLAAAVSEQEKAQAELSAMAGGFFGSASDIWTGRLVAAQNIVAAIRRGENDE